MAEKLPNPDDLGSEEETVDLGNFNFPENMKADIGISFKEGKHVDDGPPYK